MLRPLSKPVKKYFMAQLVAQSVGNGSAANIRYHELRQVWIRAFLLARVVAQSRARFKSCVPKLLNCLNWVLFKYIDSIKPNHLCWTPSRQASRHTCP